MVFLTRKQETNPMKLVKGNVVLSSFWDLQTFPKTFLLI